MKKTVPYIILLAFLFSFHNNSLAQVKFHEELGPVKKKEHEDSTTEYACNDQSLCDVFGEDDYTMKVGNGSTSSVLGNDIQGEFIQVTGEFVIDNSMTFENCTFRMDNDAIIRVESGEELVLKNCRLFSCKYMWEGIKVEDEGIIRILENTAIENAWTAVEMDNPSQCTILDSYFNRNFIGIKIKNNLGFCDFQIAGCVFSCKFGLLEIPPDTFLVSGGSRHAIVVENSVFVNIGSTNEGLNYFHHNATDIVVESSEVFVRNSKFLIGGWYNIAQRVSGYNIFASNNSLVCVHGLGGDEGDEVTFEDGAIQANIYGSSSTVIVRDAIFMRTKRHAIQIEYPGEHYFRIEDNRFIWWNQPPTAVFKTRNVIKATRGTVENDWIRDNYFNYEYAMEEIDGGGSIIAVLGNQTTSNALGISNNEIWCEGSIAIAVNAGNTHSNEILSNQIYANDDAITGISFSGGVSGTDAYTGNSIKSNIIQDGNNTYDYGIQVKNAPGLDICSNQLSVSGIGTAFIGNCQNTIVGSNSFENNDIGLLLDGNGVTLGNNTNDHRANTWTGTFNTFAAQHTGTDFANSPFRYNSNAGNCGEQSYSPSSNGVLSISPATGWFIEEEECPQLCGILGFVSNDTGDPTYVDANPRNIESGKNNSTDLLLEKENSKNMDLDQQWLVYPNPASTHLYFQNIEVMDVEIVNVFGQSVFKDAYFIDGSINISHLAPGTYFVKGQSQKSNQPVVVPFVKTN